MSIFSSRLPPSTVTCNFISHRPSLPNNPFLHNSVLASNTSSNIVNWHPHDAYLRCVLGHSQVSRQSPRPSAERSSGPTLPRRGHSRPGGQHTREVAAPARNVLSRVQRREWRERDESGTVGRGWQGIHVAPGVGAGTRVVYDAPFQGVSLVSPSLRLSSFLREPPTNPLPDRS